MRFLIICLLLATHGFAQEGSNQYLDLPEAIRIARSQSPLARQAEFMKESRYWEYKVYESGFLPQLSFEGTLPNFTRSINSVVQPDGSQEFREVSQRIASARILLEQNIGLTGGRVYMGSGLQRIDNFSPVENFSYNTNPVQVGLVQPIVGFNDLVWQRRIEPMRYEESRRGYVSEMEQIALDVSHAFFDYAMAQAELELAQANKASYDTLMQIAKGRYDLGRLGEDELLQLEVSQLNASQAILQGEVDLESAALQLAISLGYRQAQDFNLQIPDQLPELDLNRTRLLDEARSNSAAVLRFRVDRLQAEREVAQAKGQSGFQMDLMASFGLTQQATNLSDAYINPLDQQIANIGIRFPILDWGRTKARVKTAQAMEEKVLADIEQEEINFEQEIIRLIRQLEIVRGEVNTSTRILEISEKRLQITQNRYKLANIQLTEVNIARDERDRAQRARLDALRRFWLAYYQIRQLTLYDPVLSEKIHYE